MIRMLLVFVAAIGGGERGVSPCGPSQQCRAGLLPASFPENTPQPCIGRNLTQQRCGRGRFLAQKEHLVGFFQVGPLEPKRL